MKESIGGISLTMIVIVLILLFAGIMSLTISRSNAIAVKDKIMRIVEEYDGFNVINPTETTFDTACNGYPQLCDMLETINSYSYRQSGKCPEVDGDSEIIGFQRDGSVTTSGISSFCIVKTPAGIKGTGKYYYKVIMFYGIDMPVLKEVLNFKAVGETKMLNN